MTNDVSKPVRLVRILIAAFALAASIAPTFAWTMEPTETYTHQMCDGVLNPEAKKCITVRIELYAETMKSVDSGKLWLNENVCGVINKMGNVRKIYQSDIERGIFRMPSRLIDENGSIYPYEWIVPVDCEYQYTINWINADSWFGSKKELRIAPIKSSSDICIRRRVDGTSIEPCSP